MFSIFLPIQWNWISFKGRMAYVIDLEEEGEVVNDIPTTTIRSKADVAGNVAHQQASTLSTNDIVINKLTQVGFFNCKVLIMTPFESANSMQYNFNAKVIEQVYKRLKSIANNYFLNFLRKKANDKLMQL